MLADAGERVILIEPYDRLGGNQRSNNIGPYTFDIGSFVFFSGSPFFRRFPGAEATCQPAHIVVDRITPQRRISRYPFSVADDLFWRGPIEVALTGLSLAWGRLTSRSPKSAGSFARYYLGRRLFVESGLEAYIERLCGIPADAVEHQFAEKRMNWIARALSFESLAGMLRRKRDTGPAPAVLVRPRGGFEHMFAAVAAQLEAKGVDIRLGASVEKIERVDGGFNLTTTNGVVRAGRVISSLPLTVTAQACGLAAPDIIRSLPLLSLYVAYDGELGFPSQVLYNFTPTGSWKRLTVHSRIYGQAEGREYLSVEAPLAHGPVDAEAEFAAFLSFMREHHLLTGHAMLVGHERTDFAYPTYAHGSMAASEALIEELEAMGVEMLGRQGRFDYIPTSSRATELVAERLGKNGKEGSAVRS